ncbi:MAG: TonB-dependent receptor [Bacteroidales bacterium]|nr:TonB-dependent receptor [Bacteroidales bacterium]
MKKITAGFVLAVLIITPIFSQNPLNTRLNKWYVGTLVEILEEIEHSNGVKIIIDQESLEEIRVNSHPSNISLSKFLDPICKLNKLEYYMDMDGFIHLCTKGKRKVNQKPEYSSKTYTGSPQKNGYTITGKIVDEFSGESLPFVNIIVMGSTVGTYSNVDGYFTLHNVPSDTSRVEISYLGYQKKRIFLSPEMNYTGIEFELIPDTREVGEVIVTAENKDILQTNDQVGLIKFSPYKLFTLPNLGERDVFRSFQLMPGISAANENSSGLYVRGGTPDQVLVLYDGFTVYNVEHLFGFYSAFNSNAIKDVQLFKGGIEPKYGGRLSSVANITGKDGNEKQFNAAFDVGLLSLNGFIESPIGNKTTVIIAGRRSWKSSLYDKIFDQYVDEAENPMLDRFRSQGENTAKSYFYDLNGKLTTRPTDKDKISLSIYSGEDILDNAIEPNFGGGMRGGGMGFTDLTMTNTDLTNWGNLGSSLKWSRKWSEKFYSNVLLSYSSYFSTRNRTSEGSYTNEEDELVSINRGHIEDNQLKDYSGKIDFEYRNNDWNTIEFGTKITYNDIKYNYSQNDTLTIIDRHTTGITNSAYLQDRLELMEDRLKIMGGIRYTYFSGTGKSYFEPRLNASFNINDNIKLKASAGRYYQFAMRVVREDILEGSRDFWALADDDLLPVSSSNQYIAGISWENPGYLIDLEAYYKPLYNMTEYSLRYTSSQPGPPGEGSGTGVTYDEHFFTGDGSARGIDILLQKKLGNYTGWLGYTWGQVVYNFPDFGDYDFYANHDVTHEFKAVNSYKWRNWTFAGTWMYITGRPYTTPEGGYQIDLLDGTTSDYINVSVKNGYRLPNYHRLDLSASYNFKLGGTMPCNLNFSIFNAYGRKNVWYREYQIIENEVIETDVNFLGFTPNISLNIKFR